jgi:hypothetical protein
MVFRYRRAVKKTSSGRTRHPNLAGQWSGKGQPDQRPRGASFPPPATFDTLFAQGAISRQDKDEKTPISPPRTLPWRRPNRPHSVASQENFRAWSPP